MLGKVLVSRESDTPREPRAFQPTRFNSECKHIATQASRNVSMRAHISYQQFFTIERLWLSPSGSSPFWPSPRRAGWLMLRAKDKRNSKRPSESWSNKHGKKVQKQHHGNVVAERGAAR